jgi:hypothetical protein
MRVVNGDMQTASYFKDFEWKSLWENGEVDEENYNEWIKKYDLAFLFYDQAVESVAMTLAEPAAIAHGAKTVAIPPAAADIDQAAESVAIPVVVEVAKLSKNAARKLRIAREKAAENSRSDISRI